MSNPGSVENGVCEADGDEGGLVNAALGGASDAFDELVRRHQRRAVALAYRMLGDSHTAADIAQDAFIRAFRSLEQLQDRQRFGPWLMRIVCNLSLNQRRSQKRLRVVGEPEEFGSDATGNESGRLGGSTPDDPSSSSEAGELQRAIEIALDELPEKQRLALVLFSIERRPQKEVAEIMDCSVDLVKWNVFQARKALRESLSEFV